MLVLLADPDATFRANAASAVDGSGEIVHATGGAEIVSALDGRRAEGGVVVLGPNIPADRVFGLAERIHEAAPRFGVVTFADTVSEQVLREALRSGVSDVLARNFDPDELRDAIKRAGSQVKTHVGDAENHADVPAEGGRVVTVFSSKGGSGKSVVASNLAALLARSTQRDVALVDLDLESGDLAIMLQTVPSWTIHDAAEKLSNLDHHALDGFLEKHPGGVHLLAAPTDPSLAGAVSEEAVRRILRLLRASYPFVVVDGPSAFTGPMLTALDETDDLVLVGALDVPTVKSTKIALLTLKRLGWSEDRIKLVLNRVEGKVGLQPRDVEKNLGMKVDVSLPTSPDVPLSVNEGVPLALGRKNGEVVTGLSELANRLAGGGRSDGSAKPRRFWKR